MTIALILAGAAKARASRNVEKGRSSATLIVVPPGLVQQWDDERRVSVVVLICGIDSVVRLLTETERLIVLLFSCLYLLSQKFTENKLKCITIDSVNTLKRHSVEELCMADIVIVPAGIIEEAHGTGRPYTEQLSKKAGAGTIPPAPAREYFQRSLLPCTLSTIEFLTHLH